MPAFPSLSLPQPEVMASSNLSISTIYLLFLFFIMDLSSFPHLSLGSRELSSIYHPPPTILTYHGGALLEGHIPISILWYGKFSSSQRSIISDLIHSLTPPHHPTTFADTTPTVSRWWRTVDDYLQKAGKRKTHVLLANQVLDPDYTMGKFLNRSGIAELAMRYLRAVRGGGLALVLTDQDVAVEGFCSAMCGLHSSVRGDERFAFLWVGDSTSQCPGQCAWPFHEPIYGPREPGLVPPNGDVGLDGMVISLAASLAGAVTNPYGDGYFQGVARAAGVEVAAACPGVYGKGAYPGYAGQLRVDLKTKGNYNLEGEHGRKYLLPALLDPISHSCLLLD